jgi:hypothetical protein
MYILDCCFLSCYKCHDPAVYCKECSTVMTRYKDSLQQTVYECYPCLTAPPKKISLADIRHTIAENQQQPGHDDYILANPDHMDREDMLSVPHPLPSFPELERGVDRVLSTINSLNDNMEHVFVTLQAMDPDMVKCTTNDHNRFAVEHELMNIKQALSRVHAVYSGLIEIKDNSVVTNSQE